MVIQNKIEKIFDGEKTVKKLRKKESVTVYA